jgi:hypothetical protein
MFIVPPHLNELMPSVAKAPDGIVFIRRVATVISSVRDEEQGQTDLRHAVLSCEVKVHR